MWNLYLTQDRTCEGITRRHALQIGTLAGLGITLPWFHAVREVFAKSHGQAPPSKAVNCICIWTQGGTSHHDTFDPKPQAPVNIKGEFGVISTAIPGVQFTEILPRMAQELKRYAVLRSWNPQNASHGIAEQYVLTGRKFNPSIHYPTMGSVVSHQFGFKTAMPPYVQLGTAIDNRFGGGSPGILGLEHAPFVLASDPNATNFTVRDITPPSGVSHDRLERRKQVLSTIDALQRSTSIQPIPYSVLEEHQQTAFNMIMAPETRRAFQIELEDPKLRDAYGRNRFGQSCLLARRLIEAGVRFVTLTDGGWDTHQNNFKSLKNNLIPRIDQALPQLLIDLEQRGLLDSTLVVWLTDFGRTPKVNSASGRDHWASAGCVVMAGAGIPGGSVLGATDDEGGRPIRHEYFTEDVVTTIYHLLGLPIDLHVQAPDGRPVRLVEGRLIKEWVS
ncbi:MAG: hypothetical protein KatS3mg113_0642 [Planctomycetaceae bacterium]|nr:MAG: hypothetical protein KatS3mg113_0642 [Planctomycetaceae bacterium]